jgi:hypothetical protein
MTNVSGEFEHIPQKYFAPSWGPSVSAVVAEARAAIAFFE